LFLFVLGSIDFLFAFYQWNAAAKAVEQGARIAAVSDPVATGLNGLSTAVVASSSLTDINAMPYFRVTCSGSGSGSCSCTGSCTGVAGYSAAAMNAIVFGRGKSSCTTSASSYFAGMCNFLDNVAPSNVQVTYEQTGLGYAGREAGPVPTITVSLQIPFRFYFLGALRGFGNIQIPASATVTGEDLSST